jgi:hypothetical protein
MKYRVSTDSDLEVRVGIDHLYRRPNSAADMSQSLLRVQYHPLTPARPHEYIEIIRDANPSRDI